MAPKVTTPLMKILAPVQEHPEPMTLLAFYRDGTELGAFPVEKGEAALPLPHDPKGEILLFLTKKPDHPEVTPNFETLVREGRHMVIPPLKQKPEGPELILNWKPVVPLVTTYSIKGRVVAAVMVQGIPMDLPIPNARVHLYEVDHHIRPVPAFTEDLLAQMVTDAKGEFTANFFWLRTQIFLPTVDLKPDLRFTVFYPVNGRLVEIHSTKVMWDVDPVVGITLRIV